VPRVISLSNEAVEDLAAIRAWQMQAGSGAAAKARVQSILNAIAQLRDAPCLHAKGAQAGTRAFTRANHRIIYQVDPDTGSNATAGNVVVLRVYGPGQSR
jgi:plasmid stabilization system protein ParE